MADDNEPKIETEEPAEVVVDTHSEPEAPDVAETEPEETEKPESTEVSSGIDKPVTNAGKPSSSNKFKRIFDSYWAKKKWTLPVTVVALIVLLLGVPLTRYELLGFFIKEQATIKVVDSKTSRPVSGASVTLAGKAFKTDGSGKASGKVRLGNATLAVAKQYYKNATKSVTVTMSASHDNFTIELTATGRQVPVKVINKITGKGIAGAQITVLGTESKTDANGDATVVLPATAATQKATVSLGGYNSQPATVQVTDQVVAGNTFTLTPSGKLYFLSNQSGKIDVVKANLDGTDRETVLAGTGSEDPNSTSLLASRDWKYLALLSQRAAGKTGIYLIDTSTDKATDIDDAANSSATFSFVGWSDDTFVYQVGRSNVNNWQSGGQALKSYDAANSKLNVVDQTQGEGTSAYDYGFNQFGSVYILGKQLVYTKNWYSSTYPDHLGGKSASLIKVNADGSSKASIKDFPVPSGTQYVYYITIQLYEPTGLYVQVPNGDGSNTYYAYEDGNIKTTTDVSDATFYQKTYPTYLESPSDKLTFWSDNRDGKNALFVGDDQGKNQKQVGTFSEYTTYGWYSDKYLLVSKSSSEVYIMPVSGSTAPLKVTDYYKPPITYRGYGGGYGGL